MRRRRSSQLEWQWEHTATTTTQIETVMTTPSTTAQQKKTMLGESNDEETINVEIAAFAAMVQSSSDEKEEGDDNASLVSRNDGRSGLLIDRGDEQHVDGIARKEEEGCDDGLSSLLKNSTLDSTSTTPVEDDEGYGDDAESLVPPAARGVRIRTCPSPNDAADDDDDELHDERNQGPVHFLLARIKADPALSIATMLMGVLTVVIWTNQRFSFIMRGGNDARNGDEAGSSSPFVHRTNGKKNLEGSALKSYPVFPAQSLLGITVHKTQPSTSLASVKEISVSQNSAISIEPPYVPADFQYEKFGRTRTLLYWEEVMEAIEQTQYIQEDDNAQNPSLPSSNDSIVEVWTNITTWGPCFPRALPEQNHGHQRSLRARKDTSTPPRTWSSIVQQYSDQITDEDSIVYPTYTKTYHSSGSYLSSSAESLAGLCRPGFLIIGQGKCGTSSLYHYLTGHPRILPAKEKQIHYFRYHKSKPLQWYFSHFPTIESFLGRGALMTGEASPGYMPYPDVVSSVAKRLSPDWKPSTGDGNGVKAWKEHVRSLPKIIAIVRDPIARAVSSYKYNYIEPAMKKLRSGRGISASGHPIPGYKSDKYYRRHHLFSFEELAFAELAMLKECLKPGGRGERWTYNGFGKEPDMFFYDSIQRRNNGGKVNHSIYSSDAAVDSAPLIHLDEACYTQTKSNAVPRVQWKELAMQHPNKILQLPNLQLTQSIVGRGVYALPLGWWYEVFSNAAANKEDHIHVVCTEDMAETPEVVMEDVTKFLGLPEFDFSNVTNVGRYNVGGHRGYDKVTETRDDDGGGEEEDTKGSTLPKYQDTSPSASDVDLLAVTDALRNELIHFYHPYNERLFQLIGKRCPWK